MLIRRVLGLIATTTLAASLGACGSLDRIENIGRPPALAPISNPVTAPGYQPVST